jgi:hypothetical protein
MEEHNHIEWVANSEYGQLKKNILLERKDSLD